MELSQPEQLALKQAKVLVELSQQAGWREYLQPWLVAKRDQSFPDPSQFKSKEEWDYAAMVASVFKKVVAEILQFMEQQTQIIKDLTAKKKRTKDKFSIGG